MRRLILSCAAGVCLLLPGALAAGQLGRTLTALTLGENDVQLRLLWDRAALADASFHWYRLDVTYGIANGMDFGLSVPVARLGGIDSSLILGDIDFNMLFKLWSRETDALDATSTLFGFLGFKIGMSGVRPGSGKVNPATGNTVFYYPFVNGRSEFWLGAGYTFPWLGLTCHGNLAFYAEAGENEAPFDFKLGNDHVTLAFAAERYFETELRLFGGKLDLGIKPFAEVQLRAVWSAAAAFRRTLELTPGIWLRPGKVLRLTSGFTFPISLDSSKFIKSEFFVSLAAVFR